jgi:hypothetical protein
VEERKGDHDEAFLPYDLFPTLPHAWMLNHDVAESRNSRIGPRALASPPIWPGDASYTSIRGRDSKLQTD